MKRPQRPRDPNQLGKLIVDLSVGEAAEATASPVNPATEFARQGGLKGGKARAARLTPERRRAIAKKAAKMRWAAKSGI
ncbi:MAG: histone H1 [Beijerinckiaceae bacterium]